MLDPPPPAPLSESAEAPAKTGLHSALTLPDSKNSACLALEALIDGNRRFVQARERSPLYLPTPRRWQPGTPCRHVDSVWHFRSCAAAASGRTHSSERCRAAVAPPPRRAPRVLLALPTLPCEHVPPPSSPACRAGSRGASMMRSAARSCVWGRRRRRWCCAAPTAACPRSSSLTRRVLGAWVIDWGKLESGDHLLHEGHFPVASLLCCTSARLAPNRARTAALPATPSRQRQAGRPVSCGGAPGM